MEKICNILDYFYNRKCICDCWILQTVAVKSQIKFTREFQILVVLIFTSVIFLSVLWKIFCKRVANYEDAVQPEINTSRRRTRTNLVSPADSTNVTRGTPAVHSDVHIQIKRTFKGNGTIIRGEFIRYFENVASLNQWTEQRMTRFLLTILRDQAEAFAYGKYCRKLPVIKRCTEPKIRTYST